MLITKYYQTDELSQAANELRLGELVAFPTETVYGLGAVATNEKAVKRVYLAKGRPSDNPLIVTVDSVETAKKYILDLPAEANLLFEKFWPGSLTLIFKIKPGSLPSVVTGGLKTAAFRMPNNPVTRELIHLVGEPLVGPSANSSGKPSPTTAQHVMHDLEGRIAGIVDDGPAQVGVESTILDLSTAIPTVLRPGAVTVEELESVLGCEINSEKKQVDINEVPKAPGMKYKHYAPDAQVVIVNENQWSDALEWAQKNTHQFGVMATENILTKISTKSHSIQLFSLGTDVTTATQKLFEGLRYFPEEMEYILVQSFPEKGVGAAYMNRLKKAAGNYFFEN